MAADNLANQRSRASATMVLTLFSQNIRASAQEGLALLSQVVNIGFKVLIVTGSDNGIIGSDNGLGSHFHHCYCF